MQKIIVGKREFSRNSSKFLNIAETEDVTITHRGREALVIRTLQNERKLSDYCKSVTIANIDKILATLLVCDDLYIGDKQ